MGAFDMFGSQAYPGVPAGGTVLDYGQQSGSPFGDPKTMALLGLAQGLLNAGAPHSTPVGLGGALGQGIGGALSGAMNATQMNQRQQLVDLEKAKTDMTRQQLLQAQNQFALQQGLLERFGLTGGAPQGPSAVSGATAPGMSPSTSNLLFGSPQFSSGQPAQGPQQPSFPLDPTQIAGLRLAGLPDLTSAYNASQPKITVSNGMMIDEKSGRVLGAVPQTNQQGFSTITVPDASVPGGFRVQVVDGAVPAFMTQQRTAEQAKAEREPFMGQTDPQGRPIAQTREQFVQGVTKGGVGPAGPSISQRAGQETLGKGDAERVQSLEQKVPSIVSTLRRLDMMEKLTSDDQTFAAAGAEFKSGLGSIVQAFGLKIDKDKTANSEQYLAQVAELLKDRLASKDYGSGTGVSNLDLLAAKMPLPELSKTAQGRQQIIQAIRADTNRSLTDATAARDYYQEHQSLRGFKYPSEVERQPIPKSPGKPAGQTFESLPPAKQYRGKTVRDTLTGKLLTSDGMTWKEAK